MKKILLYIGRGFFNGISNAFGGGDIAEDIDLVQTIVGFAVVVGIFVLSVWLVGLLIVKIYNKWNQQ